MKLRKVRMYAAYLRRKRDNFGLTCYTTTYSAASGMFTEYVNGVVVRQWRAAA